MTKTFLMGTSVLAALSIFGSAIAQDDEIIVTATKREQTLQEVPVAVSVVDGDTIQKAQILDILDLQSVVPSLRVSQLERAGNTTFIIRGFGNGGNNIGVEPSVGVFVDGVYRSRAPASLGDLPALQRVEVLRGPQNTLFGKGASAGVISIVTQEPQFDWQGNVEASYGNYNATVLKSYITGPLGENTAFSFAANRNTRDGYVENLTTGNDVGERNRWGLRGQLLHEASDNVSVKFIADYDTADERCCYVPYLQVGPTGAALGALGAQLPDEPFEYETTVNIDPINEFENWGLSGHVDIAFDWFDFTSITAYRESYNMSNGDVDFGSAPVILSNLNDVNIDTLTQEFRLSSNNPDSRLSWLVGGFYQSEQLLNRTNILYDTAFRPFAELLVVGLGGAASTFDDLEAGLALPNGTFFAAGTGSQGRFYQDNENYSVFAQGDFEVTDKLTLTLGVNYTNDEKEFEIGTNNNDAFAAIDLAQVADQQFFAGLFTAVTTLPATPANIALFQTSNPTGFATFNAQYNALRGVPCSATNPPPACNPALSLLGLRALQFLPQVVALPNSVEDNIVESDATPFTVRLAYDVMPNLNVYGSYSTGFKAASVNLSRDSRPLASDIPALTTAGLNTPNLSAGTRFAPEETAMVWELGLKAQFDRGSVNVAVFDQTIEDFQSVIFTGTGFGLAAAGEQSTTGVEVEATYRPIDDLTLGFAGTFLDPVYDSFLAANGLDANGNQAIVDLSGEQPAGIHTVSMVFTAQYETDVEGGRAFIRGDYQYEDEVQVVDNVPTSVASREVNLFNASAGVAWDNGLEMSVWGRNLFGDEYLQSAFPTTAQTGSFSGYPNVPTTYGITLRKSF